ncbi:hypothetical protein MPSEU_000502900 [Mayamaea pseudoterrestris]|nr:hypothetical protein MPSEU_000502900 [Mayamaea pseudoterrestris]
MTSKNNFWKRKNAEGAQGPQDLAAKAAASTTSSGYGLGSSFSNFSKSSSFSFLPAVTSEEAANSSAVGGSAASHFQLQRTRLFNTPSTQRQAGCNGSNSKSMASSASRFTSSADRSMRSPPRAVHLICAISENLARETCVASMDAGCPTTLQVTKQGNGQAYSETIAYLSILKPNEILFNDGRRNSLLTRKILEHFDLDDESPQAGIVDFSTRRRKAKGPSRNCPKSNQTYPNISRIAAGSAVTDDEQVIVKFVSRAWFDQTKGAALLQTIARQDTYDPLVVEEYIILSAAHAVVVYLQQCLGASLAARSLNVSINADGTNSMMIDRASLWQLELLVNCKTGKSRNSLVGTIDLTKTTVGARLLRTNLMAPPTSTDTINSRLELVDTFLASHDLFNDVYEHLQKLPELDTMLANISLVPKRVEKVKSDEPTTAAVRMASKGISALISIKAVLSAVPALGHILQTHISQCGQQRGLDRDDSTVESSRSNLLIGLGTSRTKFRKLDHNSLLQAIIHAMSEPSLVAVLELVEETFTDNTTYAKNPHSRQHQECFALKEPAGSFLDIYRMNFLSNVEEIYKQADAYAEEYGLNVAVRYSGARGHYLATASTCGQNLPAVFINCSKNNRTITFTTKAVAECNLRAKACVRDILVMTHDRIQAVLSKVRENFDALAKLSDAIAILDICHTFADNVSLSGEPWCRPFVSDDNSESYGDRLAKSDGSTTIDSTVALLIRGGRFAIDTPNLGATNSCNDLVKPFVSNDTYASIDKNFTVISGINGSGKSTYLKQIAIIVILAQCGSYVPADQVIIPIRDRLCTRIGNADDQEHSISTFMMEMKETAFICKNATPKSLILLDELGRATSNEEGMSLAWAVAEYLLKKRVMTFFVTHYPQLNMLANTYPNVQNVHLEASIERATTNNIRYTHKVKSGACSVSTDYGVELAAACAWPAKVVAKARSIESHVKELLPGDSFCEAPQTEGLARHTRAFDNILDIQSELLVVGRNNDASTEEFRDALVALQKRFVTREDPELIDQMKRLLLRGRDHHRPGKTSNREKEEDPLDVIDIDSEADIDCHTLQSFANDDGLVASSHPASPSSEDLSDDSSTNASASSISKAD